MALANVLYASEQRTASARGFALSLLTTSDQADDIAGRPESIRLNSPAGGGRLTWTFFSLFCTVACTVCSVEFEIGGGMGRLVSSV